MYTILYYTILYYTILYYTILYYTILYYLTIRFHFAVGLYSDYAQMTSKHGNRLLAITGFLSAYFGRLFPSLTRHNKVAVFLSSENLPVFVRYSKKQFAKLC